MLSMLVAWDTDGNIVGTLGHMVILDPDTHEVAGLVDFEAHEQGGGRMREAAEFSNAAGAGTWPEWLGGQAHNFRVELDGDPAPARARIVALVHKDSGHRRERAAIEAAIAERIAQAGAEPADIRDLVGGPDVPLLLDEEGRTRPRIVPTRPDLPLIPARAP